MELPSDLQPHLDDMRKRGCIWAEYIREGHWTGITQVFGYDPKTQYANIKKFRYTPDGIENPNGAKGIIGFGNADHINHQSLGKDVWQYQTYGFPDVLPINASPLAGDLVEYVSLEKRTANMGLGVLQTLHTNTGAIAVFAASDVCRYMGEVRARGGCGIFIEPNKLQSTDHFQWYPFWHYRGGLQYHAQAFYVVPVRIWRYHEIP